MKSADHEEMTLAFDILAYPITMQIKGILTVRQTHEGPSQRFSNVLGQPNEKFFPIEGNTLKVGIIYHMG